eukprot:COSAG05_NODE_582_length_8540_cov_26.722782_2_plen_98_part_00
MHPADLHADDERPTDPLSTHPPNRYTTRCVPVTKMKVPLVVVVVGVGVCRIDLILVAFEFPWVYWLISLPLYQWVELWARGASRWAPSLVPKRTESY